MTTQNARTPARPVAGSVLLSGKPNTAQPVAACHFQVAASPSAPKWARRLTRRFLASRMSISGEPAENAELLVSELVTNAARAQKENRQPGNGCIWVSLRYFWHGLLIEVGDSSGKPPILQDTDPESESGRGLLLVDALSSEWGYFPRPNGGKVVYCLLETCSSANCADSHQQK